MAERPLDGAGGSVRHPTIVDVARMAEVAPSTASRALKQDGRISEATRLRVGEAARLLGYRPNRIAQSLRTRSATLVGIVVPDIGIDFYSRFVKGAQDVLRGAGRQAIVLNTEREAEREAAALKTLAEHRVSGILLATSGSVAAEPRIPTVYFDNLAPDRGVARVACANREGIDTLVAHLAGHGHSRVAFIGGPPTQTSGIERLDGFRDAVRRLGLAQRDDYVQLADAVWSPGSGAAAMKRLLALEERPTAVVTAGDTLALGAMSVCRAAHVRLPEQMALASFDDPAFGDLLDPPLTALARADSAMGRLAASMLLDALEAGSHGPPTEVRLPVELVIRRSCGCP